MPTGFFSATVDSRMLVFRVYYFLAESLSCDFVFGTGVLPWGGIYNFIPRSPGLITYLLTS